MTKPFRCRLVVPVVDRFRPSILDTVGTDFIHLTYNLFYPAVLGSFVYEAAQHLTKPLPPIRIWWFARGFLIALYCMDHIVAKKLYAEFLSRLHGIRIVVAMLIEVVTVGSLLFAYWSESYPSRFFGCLCLFVLAIMAFNLWIARLGIREIAVPFVGFVAGVAALRLPYTNFYFTVELGVFLALTITHYVLAVTYHPVIRSRISVGGSLLDRDAGVMGEQRGQCSYRGSRLALAARGEEP